MNSLMKSSLILLLLLGSVLASEKLQIPQSLEKRVVDYWSHRIQKDFAYTYGMELPYLQFLHTKSWYENFFINARRFKSFQIKKAEKKDDNTYILGIVLTPRDGKDFVFIYDKWVKVEGKWYHKYNDSHLPIFK